MAAWHELSDTDADDAEDGAMVSCVLCEEGIANPASSSGQPAICTTCGTRIKSGGYMLTPKGA